jgi:hypothetical protein
MRPTPLLAASIALVAVAGPPAHAGVPASGSPRAVPVDGAPFPAELTAAGPDWQLQFSSGQQQRTLSAAELVRWGSCAEAVRGPIVVLADGGLLVADVLGTERERLKVDSGVFGRIDLPLDGLAGVAFDPPAPRRRRDLLLDRIARAAGESDRLLLSNGDELSGLIEAVGDRTVRLGTGDRPLEIETSRIAAMIFNPLLKQQPASQGLRAWVGLADGSRLLAARLVADSASIQITVAGGQTWKTSPRELVFVQPLGGRVTYLSDLPPAEDRQVPYLSLAWPYQADRNVSGGRLRCGGRLYLKGLGVHSQSRLTYQLNKPYQRFQAEVGIDDSTSGGGSVQFRVLVDGRQKYISEKIVRGGMAPVPISVDLDGAKQLELIVDYADRADVLDHADWLDARLVQ